MLDSSVSSGCHLNAPTLAITSLLRNRVMGKGRTHMRYLILELEGEELSHRVRSCSRDERMSSHPLLSWCTGLWTDNRDDDEQFGGLRNG